MPAPAWNPLEPLADTQVRDLFSRLLLQRIDTQILSGYFHLQESPDTIEFRTGRVRKAALVEEIVGFLVGSAALGPTTTAERFWAEFEFEGSRFPGVPAEVRTTLASYFEVKEDSTDLLLVDDLFAPEVMGLGRVADIGCGRNKLGQSLLRYSDASNRTVHHVVGTDLTAYSGAPGDARLSFALQPDATTLPLDDASIDLVIVKWALHHMTLPQVVAQLGEIRRVLCPGGRVAAIEALVGTSEGSGPMVAREQANPATWPPGLWFDRRAEFTADFLGLSEIQQAQVLALEDYHGHWLEQRFVWMPLPFSYLPSARWQRLFAEMGFEPDDSRTRAFGMAPVIHWGPPSIRLVFVRR